MPICLSFPGSKSWLRQREYFPEQKSELGNATCRLQLPASSRQQDQWHVGWGNLGDGLQNGNLTKLWWIFTGPYGKLSSLLGTFFSALNSTTGNRRCCCLPTFLPSLIGLAKSFYLRFLVLWVQKGVCQENTWLLGWLRPGILHSRGCQKLFPPQRYKMVHPRASRYSSCLGDQLNSSSELAMGSQFPGGELQVKHNPVSQYYGAAPQPPT